MGVACSEHVYNYYKDIPEEGLSSNDLLEPAERAGTIKEKRGGFNQSQLGKR